MDVVELVRLVLTGFCDSWKGFRYIFVLIGKLFPRKQNTKPNNGLKLKDDIELENKIVKTLQTAIKYNFVFTIPILFVLYIIFPLINLILYASIHESTVLSINSCFYNLGLICRIFPIYIYRAGHLLIFQDIAVKVHEKKKGKPREWGSVYMRLSDSAFNLVVQLVFCGQLWLISILPSIIISYYPQTERYLSLNEWYLHILNVSLTSISYSLMIFEYKWYYLAWTLHRRLGSIERNWPYFLSYSFCYAYISTYFNSYCLNALITGYLFPFFLISAYESEPEEYIRSFTIPFFQPSVAFTNYLIKILKRKANS